MPLATETFDLAAEAEALDAECVDLGEQARDLSAGTPAFETIEAEANRANRMRNGVEWALGEWDVETVELGALTAGEYAKMEDYLPDGSAQARRNVFVAMATVDAPYVREDVEATIAAVADECHPWFTRWAEDRAQGLLRGSGADNPFYRTLLGAADG